jgi:drug/metabolite transporter (DMT)-like permease
VNPIIAVILGTVVLKEPFNVRMAMAAAIVLVGMALVRAPQGVIRDQGSEVRAKG